MRLVFDGGGHAKVSCSQASRNAKSDDVRMRRLESPEGGRLARDAKENRSKTARVKQEQEGIRRVFPTMRKRCETVVVVKFYGKKSKVFAID